ncbi:MAG: glycosyltransferase family 4 protein [Novosphingobium sp.]
MRILHLHSSFDPGGKELRAARLINAFGYTVAHSIVSAKPGALGAASAIDPSISVYYPDTFPTLNGRPLPKRLRRIAEAMRGYDLILTYNWGAMDAVMAHSLFGKIFDLPPLVHHEDGFNEDEAKGLKRSRNWFRRIALARTSGLVVPSTILEKIALEAWQQPAWRVHRIANGIDMRGLGGKVRRDALPRVIKREGEFWLGTLAGLRKVKNLPRLVRAFASLPEEWQLVILGEGPEREAIRAEAMRLDLSHRVHMPGFVPDPAKAAALFDLFALSSDSEQFPISVVEAMASGLAVVSPAVGDVAAMVAEENLPFVVPAGNDGALADALCALADDPALRRSVGQANRKRARADYDEKRMIDAYRALYGGVLGSKQFP